MPDADQRLQEGVGEVRRTRQHVEGCFAPFVGKECDCPPETVWVPRSVAENLATALEFIAGDAGAPSTCSCRACVALAEWRRLFPKAEETTR